MTENSDSADDKGAVVRTVVKKLASSIDFVTTSVIAAASTVMTSVVLASINVAVVSSAVMSANVSTSDTRGIGNDKEYDTNPVNGCLDCREGQTLTCDSVFVLPNEISNLLITQRSFLNSTTRTRNKESQYPVAVQLNTTVGE